MLISLFLRVKVKSQKTPCLRIKKGVENNNGWSPQRVQLAIYFLKWVIILLPGR